MHEKHLLLPSAKTVVLVQRPSPRSGGRYLRYFVIGVGLLCVIAGAADVSSRFARATFGEDAAFVAFAPAVALDNRVAPTATSTPGVLVPARLRIPALGVSAGVEVVGKKADGSMGTPKNFDNVSWYSLGSKPGQAGSAVFAGHVNNALMKPGVFEHLSQLKKGDYVTVDDAEGHSKVYRVYSVETYEQGADTAALFATTGAEQLVLITCDGDWVPAAKTFDRRLVIVARPAY
ncbi:class F sortase [Candidatus Kaiserbacteria bacterium]|nr:class F sortase [Candidatus Kaiserbacteria bacterium]